MTSPDLMDRAREKSELHAKMRQIVDLVLPFAGKVKARMQQLGKRHVRVKCPQHDTPKDQGPYVHARLAGSRDHLHMACEDAACPMRMME